MRPKLHPVAAIAPTRHDAGPWAGLVAWRAMDAACAAAMIDGDSVGSRRAGVFRKMEERCAGPTACSN